MLLVIQVGNSCDVKEYRGIQDFISNLTTVDPLFSLPLSAYTTLRVLESK
jgi:hypothetical protein